MTTIPDDIMEAASKAHLEILGRGKQRPVTTIARALMAERDAATKAERVGLHRKFWLGSLVTKTKGSSWTGHVVGFYSTDLTPIGYAVESINEPGSVQIYPESALAAAIHKGGA